MIIVGMSGGVDSSIAALLLKEQGNEVQGLFMKNWEEDDTDNYCSAAADLRDAQAVCVALHTVNFATEYWDQVFSYCLDEFKVGRTPNPDVLCNREIKFKYFLEHALQLGANTIATGHYARIEKRDGYYQLLKGIDPDKDQSYFLHRLTQAQLAPSQFPIGHLTKTQVRALASQAQLATHQKKDSTGLCFIGERPFRDFLKRFLPAQPGPIETPNGLNLGEHEGVMLYTLGQRQGLKIGGQAGGSGEPWYVVAKDLPNNRLIVAQGHDHPLLFSQTVKGQQLHWITGEAPTIPYTGYAKIRYRQTDQACVIKELTADECVVEFAQPQRAVTPGQAMVFYQGEICLGGAVCAS